MNLLQAIYDKLTESAKAESEKSRKQQERKILSSYRESCKGKHQTKWAYSVMCKNMKRNNEQHALTLERKLAKWNWLKRLI